MLQTCFVVNSLSHLAAKKNVVVHEDKIETKEQLKRSIDH